MARPLPLEAPALPGRAGPISEAVAGCSACPRLARYVASFRDRAGYWARPVPGIGDPAARVLVLGLAPGAHGANRTGRPFTGDGSAGLLFQALAGAGLARLPAKGPPELSGVFVTNAVKCAPPENRPLLDEIRRCGGFLADELAWLERVRVVVALGRIAHDALLRLEKERGALDKLSRFPFAHGAAHLVGEDGPAPRVLLDCYHPSRQNLNTGRVDLAMIRDVLIRARALASGDEANGRRGQRGAARAPRAPA